MALDRKTLKIPDPFLQAGRKALALMDRSSRRWAPVLVLGVAALVAVFLYDWWHDRKLTHQTKALYEAASDKSPEKWNRVKAFVDQHGVTERPGYVGATQLADHYFDEAKKVAIQENAVTDGVKKSGSDAVQWYLRALEFKGLIPVEKQLLQIQLASTKELMGLWDEAVAEYEKAGAMPGEAKGLAMLGVGRAYELKGLVDKAIATYEKASVDFQGDEYGRMARNQVRRLKSHLWENSTK